MKESKKVTEFKAFFNNYKIDIERDLFNFSSTCYKELDLLHRGYDRLGYEIDDSETELKGALSFLHVMGYIDFDTKYSLACEVIDYFLEMRRSLDRAETKAFNEFQKRLEQDYLKRSAEQQQKPLEA